MKRVTKSVTALLLALVLSLTLLPAQALAADTAPAQTTYIGSYVNPAYAGKIGIPRRQSTLSVQTAQITQPKKAGTVYTSEAAAAADLRKQMVSRSEVMSVTLRSASKDVETIALNLWNLAIDHVEGSGTTGDYLRWQFAAMSCSVAGESLDSGYRYTFTYVPDTTYSDTIWLTTNAQEAALTNYIRNTILPQLSLGGKTTYQKVQAIYNWITANVKYDYSHMNDPTYWPQYTAYAAAVQKKAVCQGYANLFYRLANDAGIDCRIITGKAYNGTQTEDHAWNIVRMEDEKYYCLDATWDAGLKPEKYEYFLKGLTSFSRDHQAETDKLNTPYWTQYQSRTSATDYKASSAPTVTGGNDSQGRPTLKWNAVTGAAKYEVYRARSKDGDYIKYSTVTGTSYTNTGYIENGNTYYYKVRALDASGTAGAWSSIVSVTYKQILSAPTVTGGNDAQGRPTLKWNAVSGAAKYEVYRSYSENGTYTKYSTTTGTSYTNTGYIENGNTYYYKVRALDANGRAGAWSSIVSVTYKQTLPAPTVTGGNDAQGRPTLKWNAVSGAAKYEVYRARSKDGDYIKYSTVTGTSYTNTSYIEDGNTYYYKVRALKSDGTAGAWSSIVSVTYRAASTGTLSAPSVTGGKDSQGRPTLKWNAVTGAAKYEVYRARSKDGTYTKYSTTTGTAYTNSSYLTSGATYYYKVRALDANGNAGPYSAVVSVTCRLKLTAPTVTGSTDSQGRPTLKWNAVTGAAKYEVYRARSKDGDYIKYSTVTGTSYTNTSYLANGTTYYYKVRALGSDGTAGPDSTPVSVTYKAPFGAPLVTGSKDSQGRPALKWDKVTDAAKYEVYRARSKDGTYSLMSTQSATGYTNTSYLANGTTYYYKVRALKANGTASAYSSVVTITYGTVPTPAAPAMRSAKADSAGITVSWDTAANAVTYNVYRTADAGSSWTQVASSVKGTSYKDTTVQKGVKYGYKVRGVAADGKTLGPMSSTGVTAKVTAASTTPDYVKLKSAKSDPGNGILLTWESAADAKTYNVYRKVDGASGWTPLASSVSGTSYRDTSGKRGTTYVYTVRGVAADGKTLSRTYNTDGLRATVR
jgi:fibronectin type 3 domain-containing protein